MELSTPPDFYRQLYAFLERRERVAVATILAVSGSAPRSPGTKMIVREEGEAIGTIGGGPLEARILSLAKTVIKEHKPAHHKFSFSKELAAESGMICGGSAEVLVEFFDGSERHDLDFFQNVCNAFEKGKRVQLATYINSSQGYLETEKGLVREESLIAGSLELIPELHGVLGKTRKSSQPVLMESEEGRYFIEYLASSAVVCIFGAGHIAEKLAPLCALVGFQTIVLDDRSDFANRERFPTADGIIVLDSFKDAFGELETDNDSYLVIVTRGHVHDKDVLSQALESDAAYIGMIGSKRKRDAIYEALTEEGFTSESIEKVHSPIGLDIKAESPEEIAVSIVAELIKVRAKR